MTGPGAGRCSSLPARGMLDISGVPLSPKPNAIDSPKNQFSRPFGRLLCPFRVDLRLRPPYTHQPASPVTAERIVYRNTPARVGRMDHFAVSSINSDVTNVTSVGAEKEEVAGLDIVPGDFLAAAELLGGGTRQSYARFLAVQVLREPRAVKSSAAGAAVPIARATEGQSSAHDSGGAKGSLRGGRGYRAIRRCRNHSDCCY